MDEKEMKTVAKGWTYTVTGMDEAMGAMAVWAKRAEDEDAAIAGVRGLMMRYMRRKIDLILHDFGWSGNESWCDWMRSELTLKRVAEQRCESLVKTCDDLGAEVDDLKAQLSAKRKRTPRKKKQ